MVYGCKMLAQQRGYNVVSSLGEKTVALMEHSPRQEGNLFIFLALKAVRIFYNSKSVFLKKV